MRKQSILLFFLANAWALVVPAAYAQAVSKDDPTVTDQDIKLLRKDLRSEKKQLIATHLKLTDAEAAKFWPLYDQYSAEMAKLGDQKYALI
jgi:Spy/CpxP family protein refolding chaperone